MTGLWLLGFAAVLALVTIRPRSGVSQYAGDLGLLSSVVLAFLGCLSAARRGGPQARAWTGLSVAMGVWTAGMALYAWYGLTRDHVYPFPSLADAGFVGYALPAIAGLLLFPRAAVRSASRLREVLDAAVIASSVLFVSWATVLGPLYASGGEGLGRTVGLGYPVVDIFVISVVLTLGSRVGPGQRGLWVALGGGLLLLTITDSFYVSLLAKGQSALTGTPLVLGWLLAMGLIALASQVRTPAEAPTHPRHFTVVQELLPVVPLAVAVGVAGSTDLGGDDAFLVANAVLVLALFITQQVVAAVERVRLAGDLEATVARRTAELASVDGRFRALVESSDDPIMSVTTEGVVTTWNAAAERLFGYAPEEIIGQQLTLIVPEERRQEFQEIRQAALQAGSVQHSYETERRCKDGSLVPVAMTVSPIFDDGQIVGASAILRDITEVKAREQELLAARTAALEALEAKAAFLATMSHEIRTPMNGVIGLTGLLLNTTLDEQQRTYTKGVRGAGQALLGIIDDILHFSKLEAGKVTLESVEFDPRELVEEVGVLLSTSASSKGLELIAYCDPRVPTTVQGDPGRLRQVLINLAANALKFTTSGEVVVRVLLESHPTGQLEDAVELRFEVCDTGLGIAHDDLARLFDPFSQADASTTRRFGGTGLGLAICKRLLEAMGSEIAVDSEVGEGSTFHFSLHLPTRTATGPRPREIGLLMGLRVLVVDDNDTNRRILATQLADWSIQADTTADGESALTVLRRAAAQDQPYDIVLLDLCMPGMDGLDLALAIESDPALADIPRMLLTSQGAVDNSRADLAGVREWISKPVRLSELHDALVRLTVPSLGAARPAQPDPTAVYPTPADPLSAAPLEHRSSLGRVLVVEDNEVNQLVAKGMLTLLGYSVEVAADGIAALAAFDDAALSRAAFDVVLMDCHMPEMDGFEATVAIRRRENGDVRTPVIAMTAGVLAEERERCLAAGMDDFVAKPVDSEHLASTLARWIGSARSPEALPAPAIEVSRLDMLRTIGPADGWGLLPAIITAFLDASEPQLAELRHATTGLDHEAVVHSAHRMRGSAANIGAVPLARVCAELEDLAQARAPLPLLPLLEQVESELAAACAQLQQVLAAKE